MTQIIIFRKYFGVLALEHLPDSKKNFDNINDLKRLPWIMKV